MLKNFLLIIALGLAGQNVSAGPIIVGGGGEGEYSVVFAHFNLPEMIEECIHVSCDLNETEKNNFKPIVHGITNRPQPRFQSNKELNGELFRIVDSIVLINQELLWSDPLLKTAYKISDAVDLWIQILSSQLNIDLSAMESIRLKLKKTFAAEIQRGALKSEDVDDSVEFILWKNSKADIFVVRDSELNSLNLLTSVAGAIGCHEPADIHYHSPSWMPVVNLSTGSKRLALQYGVTWTCDGSKKVQSSYGVTAMELIFKESGSLIVDPDSIYTYIE